MDSQLQRSKLTNLFLASRPKFLTASAAPVLVGSALGFAVAGTFNLTLFILAMLAIMLLHAGANVANDYFDHLSKNDWINQNPTPFSGGSRFIQENILTPETILTLAITLLAAASIIGIAIVLITKSIFLLILGIIGLTGGFFYTAPPLKLGYRCIGEVTIALLCGILPVIGSYYLQTNQIDAIVLPPACITAILIFLVILINEFPDLKADAAVNKKTLIVWLGLPASVRIYRTALLTTFVIAAAALVFCPEMFWASLLYLLTLPIAVAAIKFANKTDLANPGSCRANKTTILLHLLGTLALAGGFLIFALKN